MASDYERMIWRDNSRRFRREHPERHREICRKSYEKHRDRYNALRRERRAMLKAEAEAE